MTGKENPTAGEKVVAARPSEIGGIAGSIGLLISRASGIDDVDTILAIGVVVGFIPAAITWLVEVIRTARA